MSKFDAVLKRIEEQMPNMQQQPAAGTQTNPANTAQQQKPALNPTQQQEVEKLADQLAKINDPNKIKEVLATIMQGVTHPQNGVGAQTKAV
jgi:isopentenyl diphosphate isomerase/L-lactate dehydrogenase-like FMN-dependent dehydrogenase